MAIMWFDKVRGGRSNKITMDVKLNVIKCGVNANGTQRYSVSIRFYAGNEKKATNSPYISYGIDDETGRLYFKSSTEALGYKLIENRSANNVSKGFTFSISDSSLWEKRKGGYDLLFDSKANAYYIDFSLIK